jgi:hypothetical protein
LLRRKWFFLSEKQYLKLAPNIFCFLKERTNTNCANWKPFRFYRGKSKSFRRNYGLGEISPGIRFSLSLEDTYIAADVLWAEENLNSIHQQFIKWLAKALEELLSRKKSKKKGRDYAISLISRPRHRLSFLERVADLISNKFIAQVVKQLIWDHGGNEEEDTEKERALTRKTLPRPNERLVDIRLRLKRFKFKRGYLVFEVYP